MDSRLLDFTIEVLHDLYTANATIDRQFDTGEEGRITAGMILDEQLEELSGLVSVPPDELRRRVMAL